MEKMTLTDLWAKAFVDDGWIGDYLHTAYRRENTLCLTRQGQLAAGLSWMDVTCRKRKLAYLYAVATAPAFRHQGLCRELMEKTQTVLAERGYQGSVLVPAGDALRRMYASMGYRNFGGMEKLRVKASSPVSLREISPREYARLRRTRLPPAGIIQESGAPEYLAQSASLYTGEDFLLAIRPEEAFGIELLGNAAQAGGILGALGIPQGTFRVPGSTPFAMFRPIGQDSPAPGYFGLAFE